MHNYTIDKSLPFIFFLLLLISPTLVHAETFSQAKNHLKKIYRYFPTTFYCGCDIKWVTNKKLVPQFENCAYKARKPLTRSGKTNQRVGRIEFEHIVPASEIGHQRQCWQNGGRKNCTKTDPIFAQIEGDLHNLVPSIGEVNADRSNYRYSMVPGEKRSYGHCDVEVDFKSRTVEPTDVIRGDIARVYFYFETQYGLKISRKQKQLFSAWDKLDPVDKKECEVHDIKTKIQGNPNTFVSRHCK